MKLIQVRKNPLSPRDQEKMVEENGKPPWPPEDITVTETEAVVQVVLTHVGDMIQIS